jgi:hypothetical protein
MGKASHAFAVGFAVRGAGAAGPCLRGVVKDCFLTQVSGVSTFERLGEGVVLRSRVCPRRWVPWGRNVNSDAVRLGFTM